MVFPAPLMDTTKSPFRTYDVCNFSVQMTQTLYVGDRGCCTCALWVQVQQPCVGDGSF